MRSRTRPISSHLGRTSLVNKGFIIWLLGKFFLRDQAGSPERARWLHLAQHYCTTYTVCLFKEKTFYLHVWGTNGIHKKRRETKRDAYLLCARLPRIDRKDAYEAISELPSASFSKRVFVLILSYENEISFTCKLNSFSYEWLCTRPRFEREALGNSEMV